MVLIKNLAIPLIIYITNKVIEYYGNSNFRSDAKKFRKVQIDYVEIQKKLKDNQKSLSYLRSNNEYKRRGILMSYFKARKKLFQTIFDILKKADTLAFTELKEIENNVKGKKVAFSRRQFIAFKDSCGQLHESIHSSKLLRTSIAAEISKVKMVLDELANSKTHKKLGAKTKIRSIINNQKKQLLENYSLKNKLNNGSILYLGDLYFELDSKARCCKIWTSSYMAFCFVCGEEKNGDRKMSFPKPTKGNEVKFTGINACKECHAPLSEELQFCYNCGERHDPFGFYQGLISNF